jgi:hypothetical protein
MTNPSIIAVDSHYKLPVTQRTDLSRRIKDIFARIPKDVVATGNSKCILNQEKSAPLPDWWVAKGQ